MYMVSVFVDDSVFVGEFSGELCVHTGYHHNCCTYVRSGQGETADVR